VVAPSEPRHLEPARGAPPPWEPERWEEERPLRAQASKAVARGIRGPARTGPASARSSTERTSEPTGEAAPRVPRRRSPSPLSAELVDAVGARQAAKAEQQLREAARAFDRDRLQDAWKLLRPLVDLAPSSPTVRELAGLTLYRLGRWAAAVKNLEAFRSLTGSTGQNPVLADSYRAQKRYRRVRELWDELRDASPSAELVTEGRIVMAGALADQGELQAAIELLEKGPTVGRWGAQPHHLRLWYALADLYERAGETSRARELFARVVAVDPGLADTAERLQALG
jgi:tetratricopeptide (TPR) repeat protein